jgi:uncharacterized protein (DUF1330 family)
VPAYVVIEVLATDVEKEAAYRQLSGPAVEQAGGRFIVRGGEMHVLEGSWEPKRLVVLEFPDADAARAWYDSDAYREARAVRDGAGEWRMVIVDVV